MLSNLKFILILIGGALCEKMGIKIFSIFAVRFEKPTETADVA